MLLASHLDILNPPKCKRPSINWLLTCSSLAFSLYFLKVSNHFYLQVLHKLLPSCEHASSEPTPNHSYPSSLSLRVWGGLLSSNRRVDQSFIRPHSLLLPITALIGLCFDCPFTYLPLGQSSGRQKSCPFLPVSFLFVMPVASLLPVT